MILIPVCDSPYYLWQVLVQIKDFEQKGMLNKVRWLFYSMNRPSDRLQELLNLNIANITVFLDWRKRLDYNASMKPWVISKWLLADPKRVPENYLVIDPDVILLNYKDPHPVPKVVYGTDTDNYTGFNYLTSKGVFKDLCSIVDVNPDIAKQYRAIGAQLYWNNIPGSWWEEVAHLSIDAYLFMKNNKPKVQAWCSEMYITHLMLIRDGYIPVPMDSMNMVWANGSSDKLAYSGFFHDAGIPKHRDEHFSKLDYVNRFPFSDELKISNTSASKLYVSLIKETKSRFEDLIRIWEV